MISTGPTAGRGRGVFATRRIARGQIIEEAPVIVISAAEMKPMLKTSLRDYYFVWGKKRNQGALALGLCSLCNHTVHPNAEFVLEPDYLMIRLFALNVIRAGEEVTINYNHSGSRDPVWFELLE